MKWPTVKDESYVQACVWYLMALHHYRLSNHDEIETYSKVVTPFSLGKGLYGSISEILPALPHKWSRHAEESRDCWSMGCPGLHLRVPTFSGKVHEGYELLYMHLSLQMDDDELYLEWQWHVVPFRISLLVDPRVGVMFFQLANTLYQIATRLSRYFLTVSDYVLSLQIDEDRFVLR